jgi:hypothetical protein
MDPVDIAVGRLDTKRSSRGSEFRKPADRINYSDCEEREINMIDGCHIQLGSIKMQNITGEQNNNGQLGLCNSTGIYVTKESR